MKKIILSALIFGIAGIPTTFAIPPADCPVSFPPVCTNDEKEVTTTDQSGCPITTCKSLDNWVDEALASFDFGEGDLTEEDYDKIDDTIGKTDSLLSMLNQEISTERDNLAMLKQQAAQAQSDPEAYYENVLGLFKNLDDAEYAREQLQTTLSTLDQDIESSVGRLRNLLAQESPAVQAIYADILAEYDDIAYQKDFDPRLLQAATVFSDFDPNIPSIQPTPNSPTDEMGPSPNLHTPTSTIINDPDSYLSKIGNTLGDIDIISENELKPAEALVQAEVDKLTNLKTERDLQNDIQKYKDLQGESLGVSGSVSEKSIQSRINELKEDTENDHSDKISKLEEYKDLQKRIEDPKDTSFKNAAEKYNPDEKPRDFSTEIANQEGELQRVQNEQNPVIDAANDKIKEKEKEVRELRTKEARANGEFEKEAKLIRQQIQEAQTPEEKDDLQASLLTAEKAELNRRINDPDEKADKKALQEQVQVIEAREELSNLDKDFINNKSDIDDETAYLQERKAIKAGKEAELAETNQDIDEINKQLQDTTGMDQVEIDALNARLETATEKKDLLEQELDPSGQLQADIDASEAEIKRLEGEQAKVVAARTEARKTIAAGSCSYKNSSNENVYSDEYCVQLNTPIGDVKSIQGETGMDLLKNYIGILYRYFASIIGIIAVLVIVVSGIQMSMAGLNSEFSSQAKTRIFQALASLILLFLISLILRTVNPTFFKGGGTSYTPTTQEKHIV